MAAEQDQGSSGQDGGLLTPQAYSRRALSGWQRWAVTFRDTLGTGGMGKARVLLVSWTLPWPCSSDDVCFLLC